ncbi:hypothetical protein BDU57DRAFT_450258 [Ampelomyces quisqualis]|uniref:Uncharacterized protein n=1 Tax=Ampelomyces quisqualis TaxID=50730 RepID=A0A6A5QP15_AMPQU|nr:hypothetical protein BDU57DRAFT_450258 [Ampelomyces quisqualis]
MTLDREDAARHVTPLDSPWDGDLVEEMKTWGYKDMTDEDDVEEHCDFLLGHYLEHAFEALGISTKPAKDGGPNKCYKMVHRDGPAVLKTPPPDERLPDVEKQKYVVNGKEYRVTNAEFIMGVNAKDGLVYFINLLSPVQGAMQLWNNPNPSKDDLPAIRSSSDIAWGLWNRAVNGENMNVQKITKFMSLTVTNDETEEIIYEALGRWKPPPGQPRLEDPVAWPGTTFDTTSEEGQALLGSNNGIAVGYFLAQHKRQLGQKYIPKITIFTPNYEEIITLNLLFWVEDVPPGSPEKPKEDPMDTGPDMAVAVDILDTRVVKRSVDGKNFVREHVMRAKL